MASIRKRTTSDGRVRYQVRWRDTQTGREESVVRPTSAAAKAFRSQVEAAGNRWPEDTRIEAPTVDVYAATYLKNRSGITARTRHDYKRDLDAHIIPTFGALPLDLITREQVQAWVRGLEETLAPKTIQNLHGLFSNLLAEAVLARLIPGNPAEGTRLPRLHQEEMCFLTPQEFALIQSCVSLDSDRDIVTVLAGTGLRWGEVSALEPRYVDLLAPRPVLRVEQAWKRQPDSTYVLGPPKTRRSRRTVTLGPEVVDALAGHLTTDGVIFPGRDGQRYRHGNFYRVWQATVARARKKGLEKNPRLHDLRHTHASWLIAAGVPLVAIQRRLGHESIQTTADRYGHLAPELDYGVGSAISLALQGEWSDGAAIEPRPGESAPQL